MYRLMDPTPLGLEAAPAESEPSKEAVMITIVVVLQQAEAAKMVLLREAEVVLAMSSKEVEVL